MTTAVSERRGRDFRVPAPFICLGIQRRGSFSEQSGRPEACHVRTQTNNRRYAQRTIAPPCEKAGRRTDSGCAVENAGASLSAQHFRHGRRRFPDVSPGGCFWHHLLPLKSQRLSTKKYIKEYYLIFRLLFIIISVEISRGRTTLPKLFLSTLKSRVYAQYFQGLVLPQTNKEHPACSLSGYGPQHDQRHDFSVQCRNQRSGTTGEGSLKEGWVEG